MEKKSLIGQMWRRGQRWKCKVLMGKTGIRNKLMDNMRKYKLQWGISAMFLSVLLIFIIGRPQSFLSPKIYTSLLSTVSYVGLMAFGLMFVVALGQIDLSFPSVMAISGFAFAVVFNSTGNVILALMCSFAMGAVAGLLNGILVAKVGMPAFVATVGGLFLWRGVAHVCSGGMSQFLSGASETPLYGLLAGRIGGVIPAQFLWFILIAVIMWLLLNRHRFGNNVRFVGDNEASARMVGIRVDRIKILTFVLAGLLVSFAAVMDDLVMGTWWPTQGEGHFLPVFAMVFVGGTSVAGGEATIFGTFIGVLFIGMLEAGLVAMGVMGFWTQLGLGLVLIIAVTMHTLVRKK